MQAPAFYAGRGIPKVRWMYPGKAYKARLITVPRKYEAAKLYIYVLNDKYVIAYRDEALTDELGMLKLEHFELFGHLSITEPPKYKSVMSTGLTYGMLLYPEKKVKESISDEEMIALTQDAPLSTRVGQAEENAPVVKVVVLPPDPPQEYEQLSLF